MIASGKKIQSKLSANLDFNSLFQASVVSWSPRIHRHLLGGVEVVVRKH